MDIKKEQQEKEDLTTAREKIEESMVLTTLDAMPHLREIIKKGNITPDELPYVRTVRGILPEYLESSSEKISNDRIMEKKRLNCFANSVENFLHKKL